MEQENELCIGQLVRSKAGHDKGKDFFVIAILNHEYVFVADGESRCVHKPKKKKVKHLQKYHAVSKVIKEAIENGEVLQDFQLRRELASHQQGGVS